MLPFSGVKANERDSVLPELGTRENPYTVPQVTGSIQIDAVLDETAWEQALIMDLNYETSPGDNVPAPVRTEVLLTNDGSNLYAAFRCYDDDPEALRAHLTDRESFWDDDHVNIHIDTFNDERRSFAFGANPHGVQMDAVATTNMGFDWGWDSIWDSEGKVYDWGYVVELAIPFSQLRFQRTSDAQVWGFDAWRVYPRDVSHFIGVIPQDPDNSCWQCQMVKIEGFQGVAPGRNIEIAPTITAGRSDVRSELPSGDFENDDIRSEYGVTGKWGVTPNMTVTGTLNPDFSQVEADALQLDINEPFALFYREKRPFFTEGADFFRTLKTAIYTRSMNDPSWGLKLTGKEGVHTVGGYMVQDETTNLLFPGNQGSNSGSLESGSTAGVLRYKRDFGNRYTAGALYTDRRGTDYSNQLAGIDNHLRLTDSDEIQLQVLHSSTMYPASIISEYDQPDGTIQDLYVAFEYDRNTRNNYWWLDYDYVGDGLRADLGFIPRVGFQDVEAGYIRRWIAEPGQWWSRLSLSGDLQYYEDLDGNLLQKGGSISFRYNGKLQSAIYTEVSRTSEAYDDKQFDLWSHRTILNIRPLADLGLNFWFRVGDRIDYANSRLGKSLLVNPWLDYNFGQHMKISLDHTIDRLDVEGGRLYTANLTMASLVYQFNTRTFFRAILHYEDYRYNTDLYVDEKDPEDQSLFVQFLFSYKINPQTVFFLGYSGNHYGAHEYDLAWNDRSIFMKIGYAWLK
jgi:hypothetical protein